MEALPSGAAKEKLGCRKGEYWKEFSTLQVQHFVCVVAFAALFLCVLRKRWFSQLKTCISVFDCYSVLYICTGVNVILDAMLVVCTERSAICHASFTWKRVLQRDEKGRGLT